MAHRRHEPQPTQNEPNPETHLRPQMLDKFLKAKEKVDATPEANMNDVMDALHALTTVHIRTCSYERRVIC